MEISGLLNAPTTTSFDIIREVIKNDLSATQGLTNMVQEGPYMTVDFTDRKKAGDALVWTVKMGKTAHYEYRLLDEIFIVKDVNHRERSKAVELSSSADPAEIMRQFDDVVSSVTGLKRALAVV